MCYVGVDLHTSSLTACYRTKQGKERIRTFAIDRIDSKWRLPSVLTERLSPPRQVWLATSHANMPLVRDILAKPTADLSRSNTAYF